MLIRKFSLNLVDFSFFKVKLTDVR